MKLKLGFEHAKAMQEFQSINLVVAAAFGSYKPKPKATKNLSEAQMQLNAIFGNKG